MSHMSTEKERRDSFTTSSGLPLERVYTSHDWPANGNGSEEKLGTPLVEDTECTTVAGVVVQLFGKLPSPGETIEHQGIQIEVLDADRRRVKRLRMKVMVPHRMTG